MTTEAKAEAIASAVETCLNLLKEQGKIELNVVPTRIIIESENQLMVELSDDTYIEVGVLAELTQGEAQ